MTEHDRFGGHRALAEPIVAGVVTGVVGFGSSFAVVLAGLRAVGADAAQASSGLFTLCLTMGLGCVAFGVLFRRPITMAWSTPGAALLATVARPADGFAAAIGAFVLTGALLVVTGLIPSVAAAITRIPVSVANAMLAGVLLELCIEPFREFHQAPWGIGALLLVWALSQWKTPRWAMLLTLLTLLIVLAASGSLAHVALPDGPLPHLQATSPHWSAAAGVSIAIPLYLVTMTSQNLPGVAVMRSLDYEIPWRPSLTYTGGATVVGAVFGGHAINLSAIAAALAAGPQAGADRGRRWIAAVSTGVTYMALGCGSPAVVAAAGAAPEGVIAAFAGIALLGALGGALARAFSEQGSALAPAITLAVAASGMTMLGIGAPFWALLAGCVAHLLTRAPRDPAGPGPIPMQRAGPQSAGESGRRSVP